MVSVVQATTVYVGKHGVDQAGCGTIDAPCRTIQYTVNHSVSDGDRISVWPGTYAETSGAGLEYLLFDAGESGKNLTVSAESGTADVTLTSGHASYLVLVNGMVGGSLTFEHINLSGPKTALVYWATTSATTPVTLTGCTLANSGTQASNFIVSGGGVPTARTLTFKDCTISYAGQYGMNLAPANAVTIQGGSIICTYAGAANPVSPFYYAHSGGSHLVVDSAAVSTTRGYAVGLSTLGRPITVQVTNCIINPAGGECGGGILIDRFASGVIRGNRINHGGGGGILLGVETVRPGDNNPRPLGRFIVEGNTITRTGTALTHSTLFALGADGGTGAPGSIRSHAVDVVDNVCVNGWYGLVIKCRANVLRNRVYGDKCLYLAGASGCVVRHNTCVAGGRLNPVDPFEYALGIAGNQAGHDCRFNTVANNIFVGNLECESVVYESSAAAATSNRIDRNLYWSEGTLVYKVNGVSKASLPEVRAAWAMDQPGTIYESNDENSAVAIPGLLSLDPENPLFLRYFDADGDRVPDACDHCPGTAAGAVVDAEGCPMPLPGDFDGDGDVDQGDLAAFITCTSRAALPPATGCASRDLDRDGDADQDDFGIVQRCRSNPGGAGDPDCAW